MPLEPTDSQVKHDGTKNRTHPWAMNRLNLKTYIRQIPPLPMPKDLDAMQSKMREQMVEALAPFATKIIHRHVQIALGQVEDEDGIRAEKQPDYATQHMALSALEKQAMGSPTQRIEQNTRSMSLVASFDLPSERMIEPADQPERLTIPEPKPLQLPGVDTPIILPHVNSAKEQLKSWKADTFEATLADREYRGPKPREEKTEWPK